MDNSSIFSEDDGHGECCQGGFNACDDNPDNYHMREHEDEDITVVDVFNMNQELPREEDSEAGPSGTPEPCWRRRGE